MMVFENLLVVGFFGIVDVYVCEDCCCDILYCIGFLLKVNWFVGFLILFECKWFELVCVLVIDLILLLFDEIVGGLMEGECKLLVVMIMDICDIGVLIIWIEYVVYVLIVVVECLIVIDYGCIIVDGVLLDVMDLLVVKEIYLGIDVDD